MKKVYEIWTYELIGKTFHTYKERADLTVHDEDRGTFKDEFGSILNQSDFRYFRLVTDLSKFPKDSLVSADAETLPYFADVTEDLPSWATWEPKTWKNCQLLTYKPNGYLVFKSQDGEELKIAMNSNTYAPCDEPVIFTN